MALMLKVVIEDRCVLKKWPCKSIIGHHHAKSSFGANNVKSIINATLNVQTLFEILPETSIMIFNLAQVLGLMIYK